MLVMEWRRCFKLPATTGRKRGDHLHRHGAESQISVVRCQQDLYRQDAHQKVMQDVVQIYKRKERESPTSKSKNQRGSLVLCLPTDNSVASKSLQVLRRRPTAS